MWRSAQTLLQHHDAPALDSYSSPHFRQTWRSDGDRTGVAEGLGAADGLGAAGGLGAADGLRLLPKKPASLQKYQNTRTRVPLDNKNTANQPRSLRLTHLNFSLGMKGPSESTPHPPS